MCLNNRLQIALEKTLEQLAQEKGETAVSAIRSIILTNLDQGRVGDWLGDSNDQNRTLQDYVYLVAETHSQYKDYLYRLQVEKSEEVWQNLFHQLQQWAYNYLLGKGFYRNPSTSQLAVTYATEAAITLLTVRFPYDRNFVPWAHVLLLNVCRREIRQATKASRIPDEKQSVLDNELAHLPDSLSAPRTQELHYALLDAIEKLPQESWQQVLLLRYFHNLTPAEIAEEMDKTASAVYNLHFKAMAALREIWNPIGYKYEQTVQS